MRVWQSVKSISQKKKSAFLCKILIRVSKSAEKKTKKKKKNENKNEPDEKIFLEENIFPRGKSGKFSLNIFRGLIAR